MKIYIDSDFKCHASNPEGTFREFDVPFFDGKCPEFIEGHCYIPAGEVQIGPDGTVFQGEQRYIWKPYGELDAAQRQYERERLADAENALAILLGGDTA